MKNSVLTRKQTKTFTKRHMQYNGDTIIKMIVTVRYDDECGNNHNSFGITANVWFKGDKSASMSGCCHDIITKLFPELKHLIKWHLMNSDAPMHYLDNTTYHARDRSHEGVEIGAPVKWVKKLMFKDTPFVYFDFNKDFYEWLRDHQSNQLYKLKIIPVTGEMSTGGEVTSYTLEGFNCDTWHRAPFQTTNKAEQFLFLAKQYDLIEENFPIGWCQAETPNLEHARSSAVAPDATLEQLRDREWLTARLPTLIADFRTDVESELLGFTY